MHNADPFAQFDADSAKSRGKASPGTQASWCNPPMQRRAGVSRSGETKRGAAPRQVQSSGSVAIPCRR
jgi:hypothetical protein